MTADYNKKTGAPPESASELTLRVAAALAPDGLLPRGMLRPDASHTILLIGNAGPRMWQRYRRSQASSLDSWTRTVVDPVAAQLDARAIYPFEGPPYAPFHRWALASGTVHQSPIGLLIDKEFGLWHAYRAALSFSQQIDLPPTPSHDSRCET